MTAHRLPYQSSSPGRLAIAWGLGCFWAAIDLSKLCGFYLQFPGLQACSNVADALVTDLLDRNSWLASILQLGIGIELAFAQGLRGR